MYALPSWRIRSPDGRHRSRPAALRPPRIVEGFADGVWGRDYFYDWPSAAWRALFREIEASLDEDPASIRAQHLLDRSAALWDANIGSDPQLVRAVREGYGKAWQARDRWLRDLRQRYAEFRIGEIARFLGAAQMVSWRRRGLIHTSTAGRRSSA